MTVEGTPAARFALEHAHYTEDLDFWSELAAETGGPVIDLGAAVGRVAVHLARQGHDVIAVDADRAMLAELERHADAVGVREHVRAVRADLRDLDLGLRAPLVLMPMNTLQAFLTRADQEAVLDGVRRHLAPDGVFAFDLVMADTAELAAVVGQVIPGAVYRADDVELRHSARFDAVMPATRTVRFTSLVAERRDGREEHFERPHTVHLFEPSEVWELLASAGLHVQAVSGDFSGSPLAAEAERQVYRCGLAP